MWTYTPPDMPGSRHDRLAKLAETFPSLLGKPGVRPFIPGVLDDLIFHGASEGERHAAAFLLSVWNPYVSWHSGKFELRDAWAVWDEDHRAAWLAWSRAPWWA